MTIYSRVLEHSCTCTPLSRLLARRSWDCHLSIEHGKQNRNKSKVLTFLAPTIHVRMRSQLEAAATTWPRTEPKLARSELLADLPADILNLLTFTSIFSSSEEQWLAVGVRCR
jgi:hypothetical protein